MMEKNVYVCIYIYIDKGDIGLSVSGLPLICCYSGVTLLLCPEFCEL